MHIHMHAHTHACNTHACTYTYMYMHIHIHAHIHIHLHTFDVGGDRVIAGDGGLGLVAVAPQHVVLRINAEPSGREITLLITVTPEERGA